MEGTSLKALSNMWKAWENRQPCCALDLRFLNSCPVRRDGQASPATRTKCCSTLHSFMGEISWESAQRYTSQQAPHT